VNTKARFKYTFYTWENSNYESFMLNVFRVLEPYHSHKGEKILNELSDVNMLIFVNEGKYKLGFEVNKVEYFVLKQGVGTVIGGYECFFDMRSTYIYQTTQSITGFFVRKSKWQALEDGFVEFMKEIQK